MLFEMLIYLFILALKSPVQGVDIKDIRLHGSPSDVPNAGRVEVYDNNKWREVCHDGSSNRDHEWSIEEAMVACRQLGYPGTAMKRKGGFQSGSLAKSIDSIECKGDEETLDDCSDHEREDECSRNDEAGVICTVPGYLGCYEDDSQRILPDAYRQSNDMTVRRCKDYCSSQSPTVMQYAGVQHKTQCFCGEAGTSYERLGKVRDSYCDKTCGGNADEICGGYWHQYTSIYDLLRGKCSDPSLPNGYTLEHDYSFGKWVTFVCDPGYQLKGESTLQCVLGDTPNDCHWSGEPPLCKYIPQLTTLPSTSPTRRKQPTLPYFLTTVIITQNTDRTPASVSSVKPTTTRRLATSAVIGTKEAQKDSVSIGLIAGMVIAGVLILLLLFLVLVMFFYIRPRKPVTQNVGNTVQPLAFDGPYDLTIEGPLDPPPPYTEQPISTSAHGVRGNQPVYANSTTAGTSVSDIYHYIPESSAEEEYAAVYADVTQNEGLKTGSNMALSVTFSKAGKTNKESDKLQEGSLYYAQSDTYPTTSDKESQEEETNYNVEGGCEVNAAYSSFGNGDGVIDKADENDDDVGGKEGWQDNSLYNVKDDY